MYCDIKNMALSTLKKLTFRPEIVLGLFLIVLLSYGSTLVLLLGHWSGTDAAGYNHGFLVLASSAYLLYQQKSNLSSLVPAPQNWALVPLLGLSLVWFFARAIDIQTIQYAVLPFLILCMAFINFGFRAMKLIFIPIIIILFALPIWELALPALQNLSTFITHENIKLTGRAVFVEGNFIHVSGGSFFIEESCSGLRFLLVSIILTLINSNLNNHNSKQTISLLAYAIVLALIANWVRVFIIIMIGDFTRMEHPLVHDHLNFGWVVYTFVTLMPYFLVARKFSPNLYSKIEQTTEALPQRDNSLATILLTVIFALSGPILLTFYNNDTQNIGVEAGRNINVEFSDSSQNNPVEWLESNSVSRFNQSWSPDFLGKFLHFKTSYSNNTDKEVDVNLIYYPTQSQGSELINVLNTLSDEPSWMVADDKDQTVSLNIQAGVLTAREVILISRTGQSRLMWYWYSVGGLVTANEYLAKLLQIQAVFTDNHGASMITFSTNCELECENERMILEDFIKSMNNKFFEII